MPLQYGRLPQDVERRILRSHADVDAYLSANPGTPWEDTLRALAPPAADQVLYVSELGPTIWSPLDLSDWRKIVDKSFLSDIDGAHEIIMRLARGGHVEGFSAAAKARIRNAFLASLESHHSRQESRRLGFSPPKVRSTNDDFSAQFLEPVADPDVDPFTGESLKISRISPEYQDLYRLAARELNQDRQAEARASEFRENRPSLRVTTAIDLEELDWKLLKSKEDLFTLPKNLSSVWLAHLLLREALIRRIAVPDASGSVRRLDTQVSDDDIFLFAAFPELVAAWPIATNWGLKIRNLDLTTNRDIYSADLVLPDTQDRCHLQIGREPWVNPTYEDANYALHVTTKTSLIADCNFIDQAEALRLTGRIEHEWREFSGRLGRAPKPLVALHASADRSKITLTSQNLTREEVIGFYSYLYWKYGAGTP